MGRIFFFPKHSQGRLTAAACLALNAMGQFFTHVQHTHTRIHIVNFLSQTYYDAAFLRSSKKQSQFTWEGNTLPELRQRLLETTVLNMMTRKMLHHHRRRERGREKKRQLFTCFVHTAVCITTLLKTCIKTSSSPNKYSYIYIFFTSFVSKAEPFLLCGTKLCIVQKYSEKASPFPHVRYVRSPFRQCKLSLSLPCSAHMYHSKKQQKTRPLLHTHAITAWAQKMRIGMFIADDSRIFKTQAEKEGFLSDPLSTLCKQLTTSITAKAKPCHSMFPMSMKATTQNDRKKYRSWPLFIIAR